jgi:hypothetical protein
MGLPSIMVYTRGIRAFVSTVVLALMATIVIGSVSAQAHAPLKKSCAQGGRCAIGSKGPGGGKVFYDAGSKRAWGRYLEAAPVGWSGSPNDPRVPWCDDGRQVLIGGTKAGIGKGAANTRRMAAKCRSGAANSARAYKGGGKSDWYLPSKAELNALYKNRAAVGGCPNYGCWSSTEADAGYAWFQDFSSGLQLGGKKDFADGVRPIRAF